MFEAIYFKQAYLGGLPLILLRDRFAFLKGAILDIFAAPGDPGPVGVLLRLLQYYEEMATVRREVDRGLKRREIHNRATGRVARDLPFDGEMAGAPTAGSDAVFQKIVARLLEARGIHCPCLDEGAWAARLIDHDAGVDVLHIDFECEKCGKFGSIEVERAAFEELGRGLKGPGPGGPRGGLASGSDD